MVFFNAHVNTYYRALIAISPEPSFLLLFLLIMYSNLYTNDH